MRKVLFIITFYSAACDSRKRVSNDFCNKAKECYPLTDLDDCLKVMAGLPDFVDIKEYEQAAKSCDEAAKLISNKLGGK